MSGLLSVDGKKILHMDRNDYYGAAGSQCVTVLMCYCRTAACRPFPRTASQRLNLPVLAGASLNLTDFCKKFGGGAAPPALGNAREYNIDLIPKCGCVSTEAITLISDVCFYNALTDLVCPPPASSGTSWLTATSSRCLSRPTSTSTRCNQAGADLAAAILISSAFVRSHCSTRYPSHVTRRYLEFKQVDGSFVFKGGKVHKVLFSFRTTLLFA